MLHYLRIAVTALSLTACVLLLWIRASSIHGADVFYSFSRARRVEVWSGQGKFFVNIRPPIAVAASDTNSFENARSHYKAVMQRELVSARAWGFCPMPESNSLGF